VRKAAVIFRFFILLWIFFKVFRGDYVILPTAILTTVILPTTVSLLSFHYYDNSNNDDHSGSPAGLGLVRFG